MCLQSRAAPGGVRPVMSVMRESWKLCIIREGVPYQNSYLTIFYNPVTVEETSLKSLIITQNF